MEDVTDTVFRRIIARCGRPDVSYTEFIHTDVVLAPRAGRPGITPRLRFADEERPLVAQIWGADPEQHLKAALRIRDLGFDGVDINLGCPVRKITRKGACSALINDPALTSEIIAATAEAGLPTSVKTRIGFDSIQTDEWIGHLLGQPLDAIAIHCRTAAEESDGPPHWDQIRRAVQLRDATNPGIVILGNGDVTRNNIGNRITETGADGVMIGRAVFEDPYIFGGGDVARARSFLDHDPAERVRLLLEHLDLYESAWRDERNYEIMKKFYKMYLEGFDGADELRDLLNETHDYGSARDAVGEWTTRQARTPPEELRPNRVVS